MSRWGWPTPLPVRWATQSPASWPCHAATPPHQRGVEELDVRELRVQIFADGADRAGIEALASNPLIRGFTTNPTLMRASGVTDYEGFAHEVLPLVGDRPVSFEVFADDLDEMIRQG